MDHLEKSGEKDLTFYEMKVSHVAAVSVQENSWIDHYRVLWWKYRLPAIVFAAVLFAVGAIGSLIMSNKYEARTLIVLDHQKQIQTEWDLLIDESSFIDLEEQVLSRSVLAPVLEEAHMVATDGLAERLDDWLGRMFSNVNNDQQKIARAISSFKKQVAVERPKHSNLLSIRVTENDPVKAADLSNAIAKSFIGYRRNEAIDRAERFVRGVQGEIKQVREELSDIIAERNQFLKQNGWDHYASELQASGKMVADLKDELRSLEVYQRGLRSDTPASGLRKKNQTDHDRKTANDRPELLDIARRYADAENNFNRAASVHDGDNLGVLHAKLEKEMMEVRLKDKLNDPSSRFDMTKKQLEAAEQNLHKLLAAEPRAQILEATINYLNQRYLNLLSEKSRGSLLIAEWKHQPPEVFDNFHILEEALPSPLKSWSETLPVVLMTALSLALFALAIVPVIFSLWDTEFKRGGLTKNFGHFLHDLSWSAAEKREPVPSSPNTDRIQVGQL